MKIVVTGAKGFIGKNLCLQLQEAGYTNIHEVDIDTTETQLEDALENADFVYHLAGVNRPKDESEFQTGNADLTQKITTLLGKQKKPVPLMISSSKQAETENAYGASKASAEATVESYGENFGAQYFIYRLPNVFGKWCRPNYNSFVATFCNNIINDVEISIHDPNAAVTLVYVDDVCSELVSLLEAPKKSGYCSVSPTYPTTVGEVADLLYAFKASRKSLMTEEVGIGLTRALYSTYLSYYSPDKFSYELPAYGDDRGVFCEMLKTSSAGQFSFFTAHPGITRGGHYHHSKNEKFLVIKGKALFKFEHIITGEQHELITEACTPQVVETVPGWSHAVTNIGDEELIVMLWANELFDKNKPDTFAYKV